MRHFKKICIISLLAFSALYADIRPLPGEFGIKAEWLYFQPLLDHNYFVIKGNFMDQSDPDGKRIANELDFHSGYRLEAMYTFCDCLNDVRVRFSSLCASNSEFVASTFSEGTVLFPTEGPADIGAGIFQTGTASSDINFQYYAIEGLFSHHVYTCYPFDFFLLVGLQYANFEVIKKNTYFSFIPEVDQTEQTVFIKNNSHFWGIGPEIGLDFHYVLLDSCECNCCCWFDGDLFLDIDFSGALLVGTSKVKWSLDDIDGGVLVPYRIRDDHIWRIVPAWDVRVGLSYFQQCRCFSFNIEGGYEFLSYCRTVSSLRFDNPDFPGYSNNVYTNTSMHGPYLGLTVFF